MNTIVLIAAIFFGGLAMLAATELVIRLFEKLQRPCLQQRKR